MKSNKIELSPQAAIFHDHIKGRARTVRCDYIERRELIYELFHDLIKGA